jgi:4-hydroxythreonine-4-phosphate dehydrogenase
MSQPTVAITMGDPAGIGPEIIARALGDPALRSAGPLVVVGDPGIMARAVELVSSPLRIRTVEAARGAGTNPATLDVVPAGELDPGILKPGTRDARWGKSCAQCVQRAVAAAKAGEVGAIVSGPMNKEALHSAGYTAWDNMGFYQECFGAGEAYGAGELGGVWMTKICDHVAFRQVADLITIEAVLRKIRILHRVMTAAKVSPVKIGVAALNPHGGEGGKYGREELDIIGPAIEKARAEGIDVSGPIPADSFFPVAARDGLGGMLFMYHDQGNIGRKIQAWDRPGVSLYLGMLVPVVTPNHGTAYDIAWKGVAKPGMMAHAITMAARLAESGAMLEAH